MGIKILRLKKVDRPPQVEYFYAILFLQQIFICHLVGKLVLIVPIVLTISADERRNPINAQ